MSTAGPESEVMGALGRMNSAIGAVGIALSAAVRDAERREREADRREREAQAVIADAERRVEHLTGELARERDRKVDNEYRRGYLAGRSVTQRGAGTDDVEADAEIALARRRTRREVTA